MKWEKLGLVYGPDGSAPWARTHAALPTPIELPERGLIRIFVTCCDEQGISRPGYVDVRPDAPTVIVNRSSAPVLDVGAPGTFDENGALCTSVSCASPVPGGRSIIR